MAFVHEPLDEQSAGPDAWRMVGPNASPQARKLAAKGLAPLPPRHMLVALYHLWADPEEDESVAAGKTVETLPPPVLKGALADPTLPPGVLDLLGRKFPHNEEVLAALVAHPRVDSETLVGVARLCPESICDLLAQNETRWLASPGIVESLYQNPHCRMSVAQKMIELAVREGVNLKLPNIDEIKQALGANEDDDDTDDDADDDAFRNASTRVREASVEAANARAQAAADAELDADELQSDAAVALALEVAEALLRGETEGEEGDEDEEDEDKPPVAIPDDAPDKITQISQLSAMAKIRMALMGSAFERSVLIRDSNKSVCMSAIKSPRVKEAEVEKYAANRSLSHDIIRYISRQRQWSKNYSIKLHLVLNPKTPMAAAMGFLNHLRQHDVRKVARSRNIPSSLATAAKRRMDQRR